MKKLLHNELLQAATKFSEGHITAEDFFPKLVTLLRDHFENLGLSAEAARYWLYSRDPKEWSQVRREFQSQEVLAGIQKAEQWIRSVARKSHAFRPYYTSKVTAGPAKKLPVLSSVMWKYCYRHLEPPPKALSKVDGDPVFYKPQPTERTSADVDHWV